MSLRNEANYLLVVGHTDRGSPGCLQAVTANADFSYDEASNAADAIELAERRRPALIVLNIDGDGGSGLDACRELVAADSTRDIPILAIAGTPPERQFMISLAVIPCDSDSLDREIHRIINRIH